MTYTLLNLLAAGSPPCVEKSFFGLRPWYYYLNDTKHFKGCDLQKFTVLPGRDTPSDVPLVLLAIIDDLLRIVGLVAVAFIIVGAIQYMTSQGSPDGTAKAQSTIVNALIGLIIAIVAIAFVSFIGNKL